MKKKTCAACGKKINSISSYCPNCGTEIVHEGVEDPKGHSVGAGGIRFLLVSLVIQVVLIILFVVFLVTESESIVGGFVMLLMIASPLLVLIASIIAIVKSKQSPQKKGRKLGTTFAVIDGILVVLICALAVVPALSQNRINYEDAIECFEDEDYYNAISALEKCKGYKDSDYLYQEAYYRLGIRAIDFENYEDAIKYFSEVIGYEDTEKHLTYAKYHAGLNLLENKDYEAAADAFEEISGYEDAEEKFLYAQYHFGTTLLENELYEEAAVAFEEISGYQDADALFELSRKTAEENKDLIEKIQGTYKFVDTGNVHYSSKLVVQEKKFYDYYDTLNTAYGTKISHVDSEKNAIYLKNSYWYILKDGKLYEYEYDDEYNELTKKYETVYKNELRCVWEKTDLNIKLSPKDPKEEPAIGMTAEQVRNSTWGSPDEINRTTTAYGIHEQWVYSNYRYIYLDDGIVTAIKD